MENYGSRNFRRKLFGNNYDLFENIFHSKRKIMVHVILEENYLEMIMICLKVNSN